MNINNSIYLKRRIFFKLSLLTLITASFHPLIENKKKTIVTKKIGSEYWILSSDDL